MTLTLLIVGFLAATGLLAWWVGGLAARQQATMRGGAPDLRRSGDGEPPFTDYGSPVG